MPKMTEIVPMFEAISLFYFISYLSTSFIIEMTVHIVFQEGGRGYQ